MILIYIQVCTLVSFLYNNSFMFFYMYFCSMFSIYTLILLCHKNSTAWPFLRSLQSWSNIIWLFDFRLWVDLILRFPFFKFPSLLSSDDFFISWTLISLQYKVNFLKNNTWVVIFWDLVWKGLILPYIFIII